MTSARELPRIHIPDAGPGLWVPVPDARTDLHNAAGAYLPDVGVWVVSSDAFPILRSKLRQYPIDDALALVSRASWLRIGREQDWFQAMRREGWNPDLHLRDYQLAFVVRTLIDDYDRPGARAWPTNSDDADKVRLLQECTHLVTNLMPLADRRLSEQRSGEGFALLNRIANQQFGDFEGMKVFYPRGILLLGDCSRDAEIQHGVRLDDVLRALTGLDIEEARFLVFGLYAMFSRSEQPGQFFTADILTASPAFPGITADRMQRLLDWLSIDLDGYREVCRLPVVGATEGFEPYNFNPLIKYPILRLHDGRYIVPIPKYLFRRVTTGLFYDLIQPDATRDRVGAVIGRAIEVYVRQLIGDVTHAGVVVAETEYERGRSTCEWIVEDASGVVMVECKRKSVLQRAKTTGLREDLKKDLAAPGGVGDGVAKLAETANAIRAGLVPGISRDKRIVGLVLTLDQFHMANGPYVRDIIREVLSEQPSKSGDIEYQIGSIGDFEVLCSVLVSTGARMSTILFQKLDTSDQKEWGIVEWVYSRWPQTSEATLPSHDRIYEEHFDQMIARFQAPTE